MRYPFIERHRSTYSIASLCRAMQVSRSGYYAWRRRSPSPRAEANAVLTTRIAHVFLTSRRTYGSPRIYAALRQAGVRCGVHRVARLMREAGLAARPRRRRAHGAAPKTSRAPVAPNRLSRAFWARHLNEKWAADITHIWTRSGWLYLAVVLDLASRRVVGWAMEQTPDAALATRALTMALRLRRPAAGLLCHSDQGSQYASKAYQTVLAQWKLRGSMSRKGDCYDNAVVESFFATLKRECVQGQTYASVNAARGALFAYIEGWYNRERLHSALGYQSPASYEANLQSVVKIRAKVLVAT